MCFAIFWYAGLWQNISLTMMFAFLTALSGIQIVQDMQSLLARRSHGSSALSHNWFWLAIRVVLTFALVVLGVATGLSTA